MRNIKKRLLDHVLIILVVLILFSQLVYSADKCSTEDVRKNIRNYLENKVKEGKLSPERLEIVYNKALENLAKSQPTVSEPTEDIDKQLGHLFGGRTFDVLTTAEIRAELHRRYADELEAESGSELKYYKSVIKEISEDPAYQEEIDNLAKKKKDLGRDAVIQETQAYKQALAKKLIDLNARQQERISPYATVENCSACTWPKKGQKELYEVIGVNLNVVAALVPVFEEILVKRANAKVIVKYDDINERLTVREIPDDIVHDVETYFENTILRTLTNDEKINYMNRAIDLYEKKKTTTRQAISELNNAGFFKKLFSRLFGKGVETQKEELLRNMEDYAQKITILKIEIEQQESSVEKGFDPDELRIIYEKEISQALKELLGSQFDDINVFVDVDAFGVEVKIKGIKDSKEINIADFSRVISKDSQGKVVEIGLHSIKVYVPGGLGSKIYEVEREVFRRLNFDAKVTSGSVNPRTTYLQVKLYGSTIFEADKKIKDLLSVIDSVLDKQGEEGIVVATEGFVFPERHVSEIIDNMKKAGYTEELIQKTIRLAGLEEKQPQNNKKVLANVNSYFPDVERSITPNQHLGLIIQKMDQLRGQSIDNIIEDSISNIRKKHGDKETIESLSDLFYNQDKYRNTAKRGEKQYFKDEFIDSAILSDLERSSLLTIRNAYVKRGELISEINDLEDPDLGIESIMKEMKELQSKSKSGSVLNNKEMSKIRTRLQEYNLITQKEMNNPSVVLERLDDFIRINTLEQRLNELYKMKQEVYDNIDIVDNNQFINWFLKNYPDIDLDAVLTAMKKVLASQKGAGSIGLKSDQNIKSLIDFDQQLDQQINAHNLDPNTKVIALLGDGEMIAAIRKARNGLQANVELSYVSRKSMMTDSEKLAYLEELKNNPTLALSGDRLDKGIVYSTIYRKTDDGTEAGLFVESRAAVISENLDARVAEELFQKVFTELLRKKLISDPEFAVQARRIYNELKLGDENVVFVDSGFKGTIPTFLAAMHRLEHPNNRAAVFLYGVDNKFAKVIPAFFSGSSARSKVKEIEYIGHFAEIGGYSEEGALVGETTPLEELLSVINMHNINKEINAVSIQ